MVAIDAVRRAREFASSLRTFRPDAAMMRLAEERSRRDQALVQALSDRDRRASALASATIDDEALHREAERLTQEAARAGADADEAERAASVLDPTINE